MATLESLEAKITGVHEDVRDLKKLMNEQNGRQRQQAEAIIRIAERQTGLQGQVKVNSAAIGTNAKRVEEVGRGSARWDKLLGVFQVLSGTVSAFLGRWGQ